MPYNVPRHTGLAAYPALERARASSMQGEARRAAKLLEQQGRGGDKHLVHVNDRELAAIRDAFGPDGRAGRRNPVTGLESFAPDEESTVGDTFVGTSPDGSDYTMRLPLDVAPGDLAAAAEFNLRSLRPGPPAQPPINTEDTFLGTSPDQSGYRIRLPLDTPPADDTVPVVQSDGQTLFIPDENGRVTVLRSPKADLSDVVAAGENTRQRFLDLLNGGYPEAALGYLFGGLFRDVGPGGTFDYQRSGSSQLEGILGDRRPGIFRPFDQHTAYQPVSNFNVGLYAEKAGVPLDDLLRIGDAYSWVVSNLGSKRPPALTPVGRHYITQGSAAGARGDFDPPGQTQESDQ